jgi:hypothetical protein
MEMPTTPPSMILFGTKNSSKPIAANIDPMNRNVYFFKYLIIIARFIVIGSLLTMRVFLFYHIGAIKPNFGRKYKKPERINLSGFL